jgi:hypothetical protein
VDSVDRRGRHPACFGAVIHALARRRDPWSDPGSNPGPSRSGRALAVPGDDRGRPFGKPRGDRRQHAPREGDAARSDQRRTRCVDAAQAILRRRGRGHGRSSRAVVAGVWQPGRPHAGTGRVAHQGSGYPSEPGRFTVEYSAPNADGGRAAIVCRSDRRVAVGAFLRALAAGVPASAAAACG